MRIVITALVLIAVPSVYPQSNRAQSNSTNNSASKPPTFTLNDKNFGKLPQWQWKFSTVTPMVGLFKTPPKTLKPLDNAQIDPEIIIHPSQSRTGEHSPGTMIAQNQFPGLQFLPVEWPRFKIEPIPITWPQLSLDPIQIECSRCTTEAALPHR